MLLISRVLISSLLAFVVCCYVVCFCLFFFFKQKTAYEMRISDWSSDVCSSDLLERLLVEGRHGPVAPAAADFVGEVGKKLGPIRRVRHQIGRASCRERVCQYV